MGNDDEKFDISDDELVDILSKKRREGEISNENYSFIMDNVLSDR